jgi:hypothetical protein
MDRDNCNSVLVTVRHMLQCTALVSYVLKQLQLIPVSPATNFVFERRWILQNIWHLILDIETAELWRRWKTDLKLIGGIWGLGLLWTPPRVILDSTESSLTLHSHPYFATILKTSKSFFRSRHNLTEITHVSPKFCGVDVPKMGFNKDHPENFRIQIKNTVELKYL